MSERRTENKNTKIREHPQEIRVGINREFRCGRVTEEGLRSELKKQNGMNP